MKQGRVSELSKVIVCKSSRELSYETEFDIWAGFGPAGRSKNFCNFASVPLLRVFFFHIFMDKTSTKLEFLHIVAIDFHKSVKIVIFCFRV